MDLDEEILLFKLENGDKNVEHLDDGEGREKILFASSVRAFPMVGTYFLRIST
jgi:hypothetical protein